MELAYKEDLFFILSASMEKEEAEKETERIANNFKKAYSPKPSSLQPIVGKDTYRYFYDELVEESGWYGSIYYMHRIDKYEEGKWKTFMKFKGASEKSKCRELVERLELGGNSVIKY